LMADVGDILLGAGAIGAGKSGAATASTIFALAKGVLAVVRLALKAGVFVMTVPINWTARLPARSLLQCTMMS
jgi:hypothetical protein